MRQATHTHTTGRRRALAGFAAILAAAPSIPSAGIGATRESELAMLLVRMQDAAKEVQAACDEPDPWDPNCSGETRLDRALSELVSTSRSISETPARSLQDLATKARALALAMRIGTVGELNLEMPDPAALDWDTGLAWAVARDAVSLGAGA